MFDSGVGGLTVLKAFRNAFPTADIHYLGDTLHMPYGEKSPENIQDFSSKIARYLRSSGAELIVIACNSASSWAYETRLAEIDQLYKTFQIEKILLSEEMRIKREDEILKKEKAVKELQKKRFGPQGDFFKKQEELIRPIQDKVFNAISSLSEEKNYSMVFDKAGSTTMMYGNKKFDISNEVIREMGLVS